MKNNKTEGHLFYMENFRAIAILLVLVSHLTAWGNISPTWSVFSKFHFGNATAVFVFIAGFLFKYLSDKKGYSYLSYLKSKCKNVLCPYMVFAFISVVIALAFERNLIFGLSSTMFSIWSMLVGGAIIGPLWFIPMIFVFFIFSPLFLKASKSRLFVVVVIALMVVSLFTARPYYNQNPLLSFFHFSGFFVLGMYLSIDKVRDSVVFSARYIGPVLALVGAIYVVAFYIYLLNPTSEELGFYASFGSLNYLQLGKLSLILILFPLLKVFLDKKIPALSYVANISFGLFFLHGLFLLIFSFIATRVQINNFMIYLLLEIFFSFCLSMLAIMLVKRVVGNKWSRYVVGC